MKIKSGSIFLMFVLLLMVFVIWQSIGFGHKEATLTPLILSFIVLILGLIQLVKELRSEKRIEEITDDEEVSLTVVNRVGKRSEISRFAIALGWIGGFALAIYLIGFFPAVLLFGLFYLRFRGHSWPSCILFAVCFTGFLYLVFDVGFKSQLYKGVLLKSFLK